MTFKYGDTINMNIVRLIKNKQTILDVGCYMGALGEYLIKNCQSKVYGIDINKEAINYAKTRLSDARVCNIETENITYKNKFDLIIFGDVIEHLRNPEEILNKIKENLKENGGIIVSVPNVANIETRFNLLRGKFEYTNTGILDKTHVHFYTKNSLQSLLEKNGFKIKNISYTPYSFFFLNKRFVGNGDFVKKIRILLTKIRPSLFCNQFVVYCSLNK